MKHFLLALITLYYQIYLNSLLDNLLLTHALSGFKSPVVITPVTSVASFMNSPSDINAALGIDNTIDISVTDPVANKGDGGKNDYYY